MKLEKVEKLSDFFVSGSVDSTAILWELNDETQLEKRQILEGSKGSIASVCGCFFEDRWLIFASWVCLKKIEDKESKKYNKNKKDKIKKKV